MLLPAENHGSGRLSHFPAGKADTDPEMIQRTNKVLFGYWNDVRGDRLAPRRFDIEPSQIASILAETFILECPPDHSRYEFRLAGTKICEQFGWEFRGLDFRHLWSDEDADTLVRAMNETLPRGGVLTVEFEAHTLGKERSAQFEALLLPLVHTANSVNRVLGAVSAMSGEAWLGSERLGKARLGATHITWPDGRPHAVADKFREPAPLLASVTGARIVRFNRRSFRVVEGGLGREDEAKS